MKYVREQFGRLDILVNSQGAVYLKDTIDFEESEWQKVIDVNLKSVFLSCKHGARLMLEGGGGKIINVSSVRGFQGRAQDLAYAPSKGAVNQLTRSLAIELGVKGINVNGIAPVFTLTAISSPQINDPQKRAWILSRIPLRRLGRLEDLFGPVIFLASSASDFVNGHILPVDGGWLIA
jgi:2-deoxy-D-gluconate 3-dehydrogenase